VYRACAGPGLRRAGVGLVPGAGTAWGSCRPGGRGPEPGLCGGDAGPVPRDAGRRSVRTRAEGGRRPVRFGPWRVCAVCHPWRWRAPASYGTRAGRLCGPSEAARGPRTSVPDTPLGVLPSLTSGGSPRRAGAEGVPGYAADVRHAVSRVRAGRGPRPPHAPAVGRSRCYGRRRLRPYGRRRLRPRRATRTAPSGDRRTPRHAARAEAGATIRAWFFSMPRSTSRASASAV
jgi:hypothetical protein